MVHVILFSAVFIAFAGKRNRKLALSCASFILFLFAALRYKYGNDYASYYRWFDHIHHGGESPFGIEFLYTFLNMIMPSFYLMVAVISLVYVLGIHKLIKCNLPESYAWIGLLIFVINPYLFLMNLSALRQCMAMMLFVFAVGFAVKRKPVPFILLLLGATFFHKSAILLLPFYFVATPKPPAKKWRVIIPAVLVVMLAVVNIKGLAAAVIGLFSDSNYTHYLNSGVQNSLRATLLTAVYFIYILLNLPKLDGKAAAYSKLYLVGTMLGILAFRLSMITRFQMYFDIFSVIAIPSIIHMNNEETKDNEVSRSQAAVKITNKYVLPALIFIIYALRYYSFFANSSWRLFAEYHTIFELL